MTSVVAAAVVAAAVVGLAWPRRPVASARHAVGGRTVSPVALQVSILGVAAMVSVVSSVPAPVVAIGGLGAFGGRVWARRLRARNARAALVRTVPDLIELFSVAARAGHGPSTAVLVVAPRAPLPVRHVVVEVVDRLDRGLGLADALGCLTAAVGPSTATLVAALRTAAATGAPLAPLLEGAAATARDARRRDAEASARRLPVTMLVPLVACILPAAVVLAVVPVLIVSLDSLST